MGEADCRSPLGCSADLQGMRFGVAIPRTPPCSR